MFLILLALCVLAVSAAGTGKDSDKFKNLSSDQFEEMIQDKRIHGYP